MTDSTDNAPDRIAFRKSYMSHAITSGPLMDHPDYVQYIRADLSPDPLADARVRALVVALHYYADAKTYDPDKSYANQPWPIFDDSGALARAALAAFDTGGKTDG